jgi:hypothetical protein
VEVPPSSMAAARSAGGRRRLAPLPGSLAIIDGVSGGGPAGRVTGVTGVEPRVSGSRPPQPAGLRAFW